MLDFQLKIYLGLYDKAVEKVVKEAPLPEAVQAEIFLFSDYKYINKFILVKNIS